MNEKERLRIIERIAGKRYSGVDEALRDLEVMYWQAAPLAARRAGHAAMRPCAEFVLWLDTSRYVLRDASGQRFPSYRLWSLFPKVAMNTQAEICRFLRNLARAGIQVTLADGGLAPQSDTELAQEFLATAE